MVSLYLPIVRRERKMEEWRGREERERGRGKGGERERERKHDD